MKKDNCDCCTGTVPLTPLATANPPGQGTIAYRIGTHAAFLESMKARLSALTLPDWGDGGEKRPLAALKTRASNDATIAMLDAWATVADVLTFYQERIANEGYLPTSTERRSIVELANLVGYKLDPALAATARLAFTIASGQEAIIPIGTQAQSLPRPNSEELPQTFETIEPFAGRAAWNQITPKLKQPQSLSEIFQKNEMVIKEAEGQPKQGDLLYINSRGEASHFCIIKKVKNRAEETLIELSYIPDNVSEDLLIRSLFPKITLDRRDVKESIKWDDVDWSKLIRKSINDSLAIVKRHRQRSFNELTEQEKQSYSDLVDILNVFIRYDKDALGWNSRPYKRKIGHRSFDGLQEYAKIFKKLIEEFQNNPSKSMQDPLSDVAKLKNWLKTLEKVYKENFIDESSQLIPSDMLLELHDKLAEVQSEYSDSLSFHLAKNIGKPPSEPPATRALLGRQPNNVYISEVLEHGKPDLSLDLQKEINSRFRDKLSKVSQNSGQLEESVDIHVFYSMALLFGWNAPHVLKYEPKPIEGTTTYYCEQVDEMEEMPLEEPENTIYLDGSYKNVFPGSLVAVWKPEADHPVVCEVTSAAVISHSAYKKNSLATKITVQSFDGKSLKFTNWKEIRGTRIYLENESLTLAEIPISKDVTGEQIVLNTVYEGLQPGQSLIVQGERTDIRDDDGAPINSIVDTELTMIKSVITANKLDPGQRDSRFYTVLTLAEALQYRFKRDTVVIYGNVVKASHGASKQEVLGNGDATQANQQFKLKKLPLTYLPAPTPSGLAAKLEVRVNGVDWEEVPNFYQENPLNQVYTTSHNSDNETTISFGDGKNGVRLPTGMENITAVYRFGAGVAGNVVAGQISQLMTRPLNVTAVINPQPATGGAPEESMENARHDIPTTVLTLGRVVSLKDHTDFARNYPSIGKARAAPENGTVTIAVAGSDYQTIIEDDSDILSTLKTAVEAAGASNVRVVAAERVFFGLFIEVTLHSKYNWEYVEPEIRTALLTAFRYEIRQLGQNAYLSEVYTVLHNIKGVYKADVRVFFGTPINKIKSTDDLSELLAKLVENEEIKQEIEISEKQIGFLNPNVADSIILVEKNDAS